MREAGIATERTVRGFDRLAPVYDLLADLGTAGRIHRSQMAHLPGIPAVGRALVVGGGTGRFLCGLLASGRADRAVSIDASPRMNRLTAARVESLGLAERATLRVGGLDRLADDERFDLIATHCFLDLFDEPELEGVVSRLDAALLPGGYWLFSDFAVPGRGVGGLARRSVVAGLYLFFQTTCGIGARRLPDFDRAFRRIGLICVTRESFGAGLLCASLFQKAGFSTLPGGHDLPKRQVSFV